VQGAGHIRGGQRCTTGAIHGRLAEHIGRRHENVADGERAATTMLAKIGGRPPVVNRVQVHVKHGRSETKRPVAVGRVQRQRHAVRLCVRHGRREPEHGLVGLRNSRDV